MAIAREPLRQIIVENLRSITMNCGLILMTEDGFLTGKSTNL